MMVPAKIAYELGAEKVIAIDVGAKRGLVTRLVGDARKLMRGTRFGKIAGPIFQAQEKIINAGERDFLGRARKLMRKLNLLDDYANQQFSFLETYLIGLRAISSDYERGLFRDNEADIAVRPDVFHIKRLDITKIDELIKEGKKAMEKNLEKIKKLII
jgi:predicted acylesterase/phospholipase RssA